MKLGIAGKARWIGARWRRQLEGEVEMALAGGTMEHALFEGMAEHLEASKGPRGR